MFGHQDNDQNNPAPAPSSDPMITAPVAPANDNFNPALPSPGTSFGDMNAPVTPTEQSAQSDNEPAETPFVQPLSTPIASDDLMDIKQQALSQLSPLVNHLEQTPEERFRTTMMMIQASDNQDLIKDAYTVAQQIGDEKARAQALLDIVNEINYFTQHHQG